MKLQTGNDDDNETDIETKHQSNSSPGEQKCLDKHASLT